MSERILSRFQVKCVASFDVLLSYFCLRFAFNHGSGVRFWDHVCESYSEITDNQTSQEHLHIFLASSTSRTETLERIHWLEFDHSACFTHDFSFQNDARACWHSNRRLPWTLHPSHSRPSKSTVSSSSYDLRTVFTRNPAYFHRIFCVASIRFHETKVSGCECLRASSFQSIGDACDGYDGSSCCGRPEISPSRGWKNGMSCLTGRAAQISPAWCGQRNVYSCVS